jgi:sec-independent protein translocase protein TatB
VFDVGFFELLALAAIALFIFGPDKLPKFAADAGRMLRQLRNMAREAKEEVTGSLGSEFADLNLSDLDPRAFVKRQLLDEKSDLERLFGEGSTDAPETKAVNGEAVNGQAAPKPIPPAPASYDGDAT